MTREITSRVSPYPAGVGPKHVPVRKPSIGLALGGGGARGLAHILMLEVFDEMGLKPKIMAGTSIGAIFGAAYASGYSAAQIRAHTEELLSSRFEIVRQFFSARQERLGRVLSALQLRAALFEPERLLELVLPPRIVPQLEDLPIPLKVVAADFYTQDQVILDTGSTRAAVAASMALPALFSPVITAEYALLDGGLVNPLPFDVISGQADILVAINVSGAGRLPDDRSPPKPTETLAASLQILQRTIAREKLLSRQPDVLIDVDVGRFHVLEFHKLGAVLEAAMPAKMALREKLERVLSAETLATDAIEEVPNGTDQPDPPPTRERLAQRLLGK